VGGDPHGFVGRGDPFMEKTGMIIVQEKAIVC